MKIQNRPFDKYFAELPEEQRLQFEQAFEKYVSELISHMENPWGQPAERRHLTLSKICAKIAGIVKIAGEFRVAPTIREDLDF